MLSRHWGLQLLTRALGLFASVSKSTYLLEHSEISPSQLDHMNGAIYAMARHANNKLHRTIYGPIPREYFYELNINNIVTLFLFVYHVSNHTWVINRISNMQSPNFNLCFFFKPVESKRDAKIQKYFENFLKNVLANLFSSYINFQKINWYYLTRF